MSEFWVFGYGSLMWNPGFAPAEIRGAKLFGFHRGLCVRSVVHRGTPEAPGLVLGLDRGGSCRGMALRAKSGEADDVVAYLRARELVTNVYFEKPVKVRLDDGRSVEAVAYIVDRGHAQYAGRPTHDEVASVVARSSGRSGRNVEYVMATLAHLREAGIRDSELEAIGSLLSGKKISGRRQPALDRVL